jgi:methionyl-tRNA synthetase
MSNKENKSFYITTTLPYANADPHVGFAMEITRADVIARYKRLRGFDVFFNTGTDEHGLKIHQKAQEEGKDTLEFLNERVEHFKDLMKKLNISEHKFIRTTDADHMAAAQKFWKICDENGYIYKKAYTGLYCVGCEMFVKEGDLINGECEHHPGKKPQIIEEENYFFKYSAFEKDLLKIYEKDDFVIPATRSKEISNFVEGGLEDFSISRVKEKMPWGIPVPGDDEQVMYVWFDALVNYISTLGWGGENGDGDFEKYWTNGTPVQYCGKDNLQFQAARWQAMLLAAGLPASNQIIINGFITSDGVKMSKSLGNVINPVEIIDDYGPDALRYYLLRELSPFEDGSFTMEKFAEAYNANLVNGIGNLLNRVMKMAEDNLDGSIDLSNFTDGVSELVDNENYSGAINDFNLKKAMDHIWQKIGEADAKIQETQPFKLIKEKPDEAKQIITELVHSLSEIAYLLEPFLPQTAEKVINAVMSNKKPEEPVFPRK